MQDHLTEVFGRPARLLRMAPLAAGACQENFSLDYELQGSEGALARVVLRSDAPTSLPGSLSRREEFAVAGAAVEAGVPTAPVRGLRQGLVRDGAYAYLMDWVEGVSLGVKIVRDPALARARAVLPGQLAACLARIHALTPATAPLPLDVPASGPVNRALTQLRATLDGLPEARPGMELAFRWLDRNRPTTEEVVLNHGDFRTGNFMINADGLVGVLDWEFAHWGCPEEDVAWLMVRDWRFGQLHLPVGGFAPRDAFLPVYQEATGRVLDPGALHFWEVLGNVRWAAGAVAQGQRYLAGNLDLELVAIARRSAEMEYEALRLIEVGPAA